MVSRICFRFRETQCMPRVTLRAQALELAYVVTDLSAHLIGTGGKIEVPFLLLPKDLV